MAYAVATNIKAPPKRIWSILTDAANFSRWNSTIERIEGNIALGEKIQLKAKIAPERTFKLTVSALEPEKKMEWRSGQAPMFKGVRTYTLTPKPDGTTDFKMEEVFNGVMLPMIAGSLPDFGPPFEQFASDLKREAEQIKS